MGACKSKARNDQTNVDVSMLESGDTIILIVGTTGVGKSTFINEAVGWSAATINDGLDSDANQPVRPIICDHPNNSTRRLVFLDTPGFNGTHSTSEKQVLNTIAAWLKAASYEEKVTLGGIIYLYDISQARHKPINGSLTMFYRPERAMEIKNVVLATTKWKQEMENAYKRSEKRLCSDNERFRHCRFMNTRASAWVIVRLLLEEGQQLDNTQLRRASDILASESE